MNAREIQEATQCAIDNPGTTQVSLIFPEINDVNSLMHLITILKSTNLFFIGQEEEFNDFLCIGLRAKISNLESWISGFGPFKFFPITRQTPYVEITFRVKKRPDYKQFMKKAPDGVIHLADLDLLGDITWATFQTLWNTSLSRTAELLGHSPDI
ncbi:MAG TPA: hypothetical protein VIJ14_04465, partial [Rhabdochlamydiaceae bacterium]